MIFEPEQHWSGIKLEQVNRFFSLRVGDNQVLIPVTGYSKEGSTNL
jgi:hypothetical protein